MIARNIVIFNTLDIKKKVYIYSQKKIREKKCMYLKKKEIKKNIYIYKNKKKKLYIK